MNLFFGDCLEVLKDISENSVDCVIADLPYGQTACKWDKMIDLDKLWIELKRVGKNECLYFFFTTTKFGIDLINSNRKWFRYDYVWTKPRLSSPLTTKSKFATAHEMIYVFAKPRMKVCYNRDIYHKKIPYGKSFNTKNHITNTNITKKNRTRYEPSLPLSHFQFTASNGYKAIRTTQKPILLLEHLIKYFTNEGDTILDPTMGSGSTGVACKNLKRNFIGIEIDKEIYDYAVERLKN